MVAPTWLIALMVALVCGALWLLYPRQDLEQRLLAAGQTALADAYLDNLLRSDPDNPRLRLVLARRQIGQGDLPEARDTLAPVLATHDSELYQEAQWIQGELLYQQYRRALAVAAPEQDALRTTLRAQLRKLADHDWSPERRHRLITMASRLDASDLVVTLSREQAPHNSRAAANYYEQAAKNALAQGDYDSCAELYLAARDSTPDPERARTYYNAAVDTLRAAARPADALDLAVREIGGLAGDRQTLTRIVRLAREADRPQVAEEYVRRLMQLALLEQLDAARLARAGDVATHAPALWRAPQSNFARLDAAWDAEPRYVRTADTAPTPTPGPALSDLPFDDETYGLAYQVFVENGKLDDAWAVANAAVAQEPDDMDWRERLAQVSEWTGRPEVALENWLQVAHATQRTAAWDAVMRLAPGLADDAATSEALDSLLRADSENPRLHLLLAQRQMDQDDLPAARATLQALQGVDDPTLQQEVAWLTGEWRYREFEAAVADKDPDVEAKRTALRAQVQTLSALQWPPERQRRLAAWATRVGDSELALQLYRRGAPDDAQEAFLFYERAANQALAQGDYAGAAQLHLAARDRSTDAEQARRSYLAAIAALRAGDQPVAALELAERELGPWADDPDMLLMLVELARSADKPQVADRYMRRLLRMSLLQPGQQPVQQARHDDGAGFLVHPALRGALQVADRRPGPDILAQPFDEQLYDLGYHVFVENGELEDAWLLSKIAVEHEPQDMRWRKRLAQLSDWTDRPQLALDNWLVVARNSGDEQAWRAVLELAPSSFDDKALAAALRHRLRQSPQDPDLIDAYVQAQERLGEPQPAITYLQRHGSSAHSLELLARLAARNGQGELALQSWDRLFRSPVQLTPERAMEAAVLALRQQQPDLGLQWLAAAQAADAGAASDADLLRLTGQVAQGRARNQLAITAYRKLVDTQQAEIGDYDALMALLRQQNQPEQAAAVGLLAWEQHDDPRHLIDVLSFYAERGQWAAFRSVLAQLDPAPGATRHALQPLQESPQFLQLMGRYQQQAGRRDLARQYYERGLRISPHAAELQEALLWMLVDDNDAVALRRILGEQEPQWRSNPDLHDALAAAYQALSLPQVALERYLTPHLAEHEQDFLWLMNYADALEENAHVDRAWRLRRHLLSQQWQQARRAQQGTALTRAQAWQQWLTPQGRDEMRRVARARLIVTQRPGDAAYQVLRELLRMDRIATPGDESDPVSEVAIAWLQDAGQYNAERGYLWQQYVRSRARQRPLWAEISLALAERDRAASGALLDAYGGALPRYDRIEAAAAAGDVRRAQSEAFEAQTHQRHDDQLHQQLSEQLLDFSHYVEVTVQHSDLDGMGENQADAVWHWAVNPRLDLDLGARGIRRNMRNDDTLRAAPNERMGFARLRWRHADGQTQTRLTLGRRLGYAQTTPVLLEHEQRVDDRLAVGGELGWQLPTDESLPLRVAGMKTQASAYLAYRATRQDSVTLTLTGARYRLQTGAQVGSGRHALIEYVHTFREEAPVWELGLFGSLHRFTQRDPATLGPQGAAFQSRLLPTSMTTMDRDYFLPANFQFYGVRLSTNMLYEQDYTRKWRPYASVSRTWHSKEGPGYDLRLGVAGRVLGADHLSLSWGVAKSSAGIGGFERNVQLSYRLHF